MHKTSSRLYSTSNFYDQRKREKWVFAMLIIFTAGLAWNQIVKQGVEVDELQFLSQDAHRLIEAVTEHTVGFIDRFMHHGIREELFVSNKQLFDHFHFKRAKIDLKRDMICAVILCASSMFKLYIII